MKSLLVIPLVFASMLPLGADADAFRVREVVGTAFDGSNERLAAGHALPENSAVRTDSGARLDLELSSSQVLRVGGNSSIAFDGVGAAVLVERGSVLFDNGGKSPLRIRLGDMELEIRNGIGFALPEKKLIGVIAGKATVRGAGNSTILKAGQFLLAHNGRTIANFNLARQVETSVLLNGFSISLPGEPAIRKSVKRFASLERRGFVSDVEMPPMFAQADQCQFDDILLAATSIGHRQHLRLPAPLGDSSRVSVEESGLIMSINEVLNNPDIQTGTFPPLPPVHGSSSSYYGLAALFYGSETGLHKFDPRQEGETGVQSELKTLRKIGFAAP